MSNLERVRAFVVETFLFGEGAALQDDTSFMQHHVLDSTGMLEVVAFLEETFGIVGADDELVPENLDSLRGIDRYLAQKLKGQPGGAAD